MQYDLPVPVRPAPRPKSDAATQLEELAVMLTTILRGMWRYRWPALFTSWAVSAAGWAFVYAMPDVYQASSRIYVDTHTMVKRVVGDLAIATDEATEINVLTRTLLSQPQLEKTASSAGLSLKARTPREQEQVVDALREGIAISKEADNIFRIMYQNRDRKTAESVVRTLLDSFVEDALGQRRTDSGAAQHFLDDQIKDYEGRLNKAEERLAKFKQDNIGLMPGETGDYYTRLQKAMTELAATRDQVSLAQERRDEYQKQLVGEEPVIGLTSSSDVGDDAGASEDSLIAQYEARLQTLLLKYTDNYPDVVALKATIARLKEQRKAELAKAQGRARQNTSGPLESNPVYERMKMGLSQAEVDLATLKTQLASEEANVKKLRDLVDTIPEVERKLKSLNRDYDVTRQQYEALLKRRESLHITDEVAATGDQLQFRVIDPPRAALDPVGPNRTLYLAAATVFAVGLGVGLAFLLQQLFPVFNSRRELREATGLPVLGTISFVQSAAERAAAKRRTVLFAMAGVALPIALAVAVVVQEPARQAIVHVLGAMRS